MSESAVLTLLLTDLVDSTRIVSELGDARAAAMMARHDRVARDLLPVHNGREIDKSDGFLHIFESPTNAVDYALAYHRALVDLSRLEGVSLYARAGMHTGSVRLTWNAPEDVARGAKPCEVEGIAKATAARIMTLAMGGQTLMSADTRTRVTSAYRDRTDLRLVSHGHYRLKGVPEPLEISEVAALAEGVLRPPPDTAKVHRVVHTDGGWRPVREVENNLPVERVQFFGRKRELRRIADHYETGARLVTLAGPGGTGKTHLAARYGHTWLGDWPGGVWFCDLAEARGELDVVRTVGTVLQVPLETGDPIATLAEALAHRGRMLLILDNFEQIVDVAASTLAVWLDKAPNVSWLVTSRQRLDIRGERLVVVDPLPLPEESDGLATLQENPSVGLFVARAQAVQPRFRFDDKVAADVVRLVRLLDGLPLAIELAAARVRVLPPKRILHRMNRRFDLLRGQRGRGQGRQATLKGTIDWSWDLLAPHERAALAQCSVFEGGFDLEAAEAVIDLSPWPDAPWPMDTVESLVDQSLVRAIPLPDGETRFGLFRSIHDYARDKLTDPSAIRDAEGEPVGGAEALEEASIRHAGHYARWGELEELDQLHTHGAEDARKRLSADLDNLVAASRNALRLDDGETAGLAALGALALLESTGPFSLAEQLAMRVLDADLSEMLAVRVRLELGVVLNRSGQADPASEHFGVALDTARRAREPKLEAHALLGLASSHLHRGQLEEAEASLRQALERLRRAPDDTVESAVLRELAHVVGIRGGRFDEGAKAAQRALRIQERAGNVAGEASTYSYLGAIHAIQGQFDAGIEAYEKSRDLAQQVGDRRTAGLSQGMLASIYSLTKRYDEAAAAFREAIRIQSSIGDRVHEAMHVANYGHLLKLLDRLDESIRWFERAIDLARDIGNPYSEGQSLGTLGELRAEQGQLGEALVTLQEGEARLREAGDPTELGKLLCKLAHVHLRLDDSTTASTLLDEVRTIAEELQVGENSELATRLRTLEQAIQP